MFMRQAWLAPSTRVPCRLGEAAQTKRRSRRKKERRAESSGVHCSKRRVPSQRVSVDEESLMRDKANLAVI